MTAGNQSYDEVARLYDIAFSWDVDDEAGWLLARMGKGVRRVLEPGCGTCRMFPALRRRGVEPVGIDASAGMLDRARERMRRAGLAPPTTHLGDMTRFDLGERFDGALCPVGTFGHLLTDDAAHDHLECMAEHLSRGARYMVQLDLRSMSPFRITVPGPTNRWEMEGDGIRLRCTWYGISFDAVRRVESQSARYEILDGEGAGTTVEHPTEMRIWDFGAWTSLVANSPFTLVAAYAGNRPARPAVPVDRGLEDVPLTWHELVR